MMNATNNLEGTKKVVVVGTGDKAHGLARMYECHAKKEGIYKLVFTEPMPMKTFDPFSSGYVSIELFPDALANADIVILAIPSYAIEAFIAENFMLLKNGCILVDLANSNKDKQDLKGVLAALDLAEFDRWVKAFNDTGAIQELQHTASAKFKLATNVCGPNDDAVKEIVSLAKALGYAPNEVPIDQYERLRHSQDTIGWEWVHATAFMIVIFLIAFTYYTVQLTGRPNFEWYTILTRSSIMFACKCYIQLFENVCTL